jgi:hypothetical protein
MICPGCNGGKRIFVKGAALPDDPAWAAYDCLRCAGAGVVTPELDALWCAGAQLRERRIAAKWSLREAAAWHGISLAQYCDIENGRVSLDALAAAKEAA